VTAARPWPAPAKLNLFLHVVGRRADGYHLLQTVFQFLDYGDTLYFDALDTPDVVRAKEIPGVPADADLCVRAARLLQARYQARRGVQITLDKRLPAGGGLGGGSSDCATTLIALNELWQLGLSRTELAEVGLALGADVPVFVQGQAAWAEGVGERLTPLALDEPWFVVVVPPVSVSTAAVFQGFQLTPGRPPLTIRAFQNGGGVNDLEPVVRRRYPEVDAALNWLSRYGDARMTGSGGCVFLRVQDETTGRRILADAPNGYTGFVARAMNRHPLYSAE
jgi:4-diphosphocytidyl-2-C-methyl-D-erythritol kinase